MSRATVKLHFLTQQEFVLIPGTVKFDFVYAAVNP